MCPIAFLVLNRIMLCLIWRCRLLLSAVCIGTHHLKWPWGLDVSQQTSLAWFGNSQLILTPLRPLYVITLWKRRNDPDSNSEPWLNIVFRIDLEGYWLVHESFSEYVVIVITALETIKERDIVSPPERVGAKKEHHLMRRFPGFARPSSC